MLRTPTKDSREGSEQPVVVSISSNNSNQGSNSSLDTVRDIGAITSTILGLVQQVQAEEIR
jgi:hypothetical protein